MRGEAAAHAAGSKEETEVSSIRLSFGALLVVAACAVSTASAYENLSATQAYRLIQDNQNNPDFVILDVRTPDEFRRSRLRGALHIDFHADDFRQRIDRLERDRTYLVYCKGGFRSSSAAEMMDQMGFDQVYNVSGGILQWREQGLPLEE